MSSGQPLRKGVGALTETPHQTRHIARSSSAAAAVSSASAPASSQVAFRKNSPAIGAALTGGNTADMLAQTRPDHTVAPLDRSLQQLHLLLLDEDAAVLRAITEVAQEMGFAVHSFKSAGMAESLLEKLTIDVVLMDLKSVRSGLATLEGLRKRMPRVPIIVMTAFATVDSAVDAMRRGASDYLTKPFGMEELTGTLQKAAQQREFDVESRRLREQLQSDPALGEVFGTSSAIQKVLRMAAKVAFASHPVLIVGESGTGKELLAQAIFRGGLNADEAQEVVDGEPAAETRRFESIDCGGHGPAMLETELFGYVRNEGTAQREERRGALTRPHGGTLFLDAVSELPVDLQARLLRAIQDKQVRPAGAATAQPVTVRILAGSSRDLAAAVESGHFRKDLYFRLNVVNLRIPALRERSEDIPVLAEYFLQKYSRERGMSMSFSPEAMRALNLYAWPGNVRELESMIQRACSVSTGPVIHLADLPTQVQHLSVEVPHSSLRVDARRLPAPGTYGSVGAGEREEILSIAELERQAILSTLAKLNGDKLKAAKLLGIGKTTLYRKLKEYGIDDE